VRRRGQPLIAPTVFAAAVLVVILTTLAAPPLLGARLRRTMCRTDALVTAGLPSGEPV